MPHLRMPYVEDARICGSDYLNIRTHIFAIEHYIFTTPGCEFLIKSSHFQEITSARRTEGNQERQKESNFKDVYAN